MANAKAEPGKVGAAGRTLAKKFKLTNHAPASAGVFVGSCTALALAIAKQKFAVDLTGLEGHISVVAGGIASYLTGGRT